MSSIWEIPNNLEVPADYKSPPNFNHVPLFDRIYLGKAGESNTDSELLAFRTGIDALIFLTSSQPGPGSDYAALRETPVHIRLFTWMNRCEAFLDYLNPYLTEVRNHGAPEQQEFIREVLDMKLHEYIKSKSLVSEEAQTSTNDTDETGDDEQEDETFPEPAEAITIIEGIVNTCSPTSAEYVALQITIRALRYLIESGEAPEFMRYVDQMSKWETPSTE